MDFFEFDMLQSATEMLKEEYPPAQGWEIGINKQEEHHHPGITIQRFWEERHQVILAVVIPDCDSSQSHYHEMGIFFREVVNPGSEVLHRYIVYPQGVVPCPGGEGIEFIFLQDYFCAIT